MKYINVMGKPFLKYRSLAYFLTICLFYSKYDKKNVLISQETQE